MHLKNMVNKYLFLLFAAILLTGCSSSIFYEKPYELKSEEKKSEFLLKYSPFIKDKVIFIDPGHGGNDKASKGNLGLVTEAEINLRVALHLKKFLQEAGASVIMSRETDKTVELKERSELANNSNADIFISIHHNAPGSDSDDWINYTSTYYHAKEVYPEYDYNEKDLAMYIQRDLAYAMRNSGGPGSFDGTYSDYNIYPKAGFAVLRNTKIPAVLIECGFFTNNNQERQLAEDEYNRIQAWGIFRGLCRYYSAGQPTITLASTNPLEFLVKDKSGIDSSAFKVWADSTKINDYIFNKSTGKLFINLPIANQPKILKVFAVNNNGNSSNPFYYEFITNK